MNRKKLHDAYPLSPMQSGLLFQSLYAPDSDAYLVQTIFNLQGKVNYRLFKKAWKEIINHYFVFRTGILWKGLKAPLQYVLESIDVPFEILDWQGLEEAEQKQKLDAFLQEDRKKGFDLSKPPLFRLTLIQRQPQKYSLIWSQHHILLDGWGFPIIIQDLLKAYEAILEDKEPQFPSRRPFRDYIAWLQHQDIEQAEKFWKDTLHNLEEPTRLSFKGLIHSTSAKDYDTYHTVLSENDTENLRKFAQDHGLTLNTLLQGAVGTVLKAYTRQREIVLGVTISGRSINLPGIEDMVGLFINTLPLCMEFKSEDTILSFLHILQQNTQKLNDYAYASLAQVQSWSGIHQSLFDVLFVFENYPVEENVKTPKCGFEIKDVKILEKSEYPLTIAVVPGNQLCLMFSYQTEHFNEDLIKNLAEHIKNVLQGVVSSPKEDLLKPIYELPLLTSQEKHQLLIEWNDTKADYPVDKTVHQLFEEQVKKTPNNTAVIYEDQELSYEQLNAKANQLAHYLRGQGVGPDTLVAIAVERSLEMIIGLLAILKAGGAYVPLDPAYPEDRLQFMLEDTNAPLLITQAHLKERFNNYSGKAFSLQLDTVTKDLFIENSTVSVPESSLVWTNLSAEPSQNPLSLSTPNNLAYVIYTSGSTGKPKGVENTHQAFLNRINWTLANYPISESDSLLYIASMGFDISVWEMLFPLSGGARVIIATEDQTKDIVSLSSLVQAHKVTTLHFVPSLLDLFIASKEGKKCTSLKQIVTGGEALLNEVRRNFIDIFKNTNLYLAYGPTEAAISVTHWNCREEGYLTKTPIGTPIANTQLHILDESLNPVPIGVSGEIYIGGVGLARGYLNRPDLTAERFVPNPFVNVANTQGSFSQTDLSLSSDEKSLRLYRTGDLARYLPDGNIEFLGRIDDQVKIRGFRIELGEIESTLVNHGDVSQVVVMAREDEPGNKKLVAYIVPEVTKASSCLKQESFSSSSQDSFSILGGDSLPALTEDLRNHLARSLPEYMVPSFFVYLDKIPLTSNGKIDRKSFPAPDLSLRTIGDEYVAPQSDLQHSLAAIWSEVLKVEHIGIHDNFFKIGGDSIISIQLVAKGRQQGIHFNVKDIFTYPTIAGLASVARTQEDVLTLKPDQNPIKGDVALTPIQSWFFDQGLKDINHFNQAVFLKARNSLDPSLLTQTLKLLISHHDALRFRYSQHQSWRQECLEDAEAFPDVLTVLNFSHILDTDLASRIKEESSLLQQALNIETGPLIRVALFDCGIERSSRLLVIIHHLVVDGVSWRILLEDLERIYNQLAAGNKPTLLSKTHSYQQWAHALKEYASSESLAKESLYWKKIEGEVKPLPVDFNKGAANGSVLSTMTVSLTTQETTDLLQRVPEAYRTQINDILLTALLLAIGDWKGSYDLSLSLEGHGREDIIKDIDLSKTVGWFTSIFPVCLTIEDPNDLATAIKIVKEELRQIPHKGIGYGILTYLTPHSSLGSSSHPTLSFNYLGQWDNTLASEGLFSFAHESVGKNVSELNTSHHPLDINAEVKEGALHAAWTYSQNHFSQLTIEKLSHNFIHRLKQLIHHCCQDHNFGYTPSDFTLAQLTQENLNVSFANSPRLEEIYPLSPMQEGLLFHSLYAPHSSAYFVQSLFNFEDAINAFALKFAWQKICDFYSIFRTGVIWKDLRTPLQYVLESMEVPFEILDWQGLEEAEQKQKLDTFLQEDRKKGFDLSKPPLFRLTLIQWQPQKYSLIWSQHHILLDGWCLPIVLGDVLQAYEATLQGKEPQFPSRRPFRDYIAWLQHQDIEQAEKFWKDTLHNLEEPTRLSFKGLIHSTSAKDYDTYHTVLSENDTENLRKFAQDHGLTLNTLLQGAVGTVLKAYTRQREIVLGVTISGRSINLPGIEDMVGLFINTLPLCMEFKSEDTILSFLHTLQQNTQKLNDYAYASLAQVQSWSGIHQSLFDVLFVFENYPVEENAEISSSGLTIKDAKGIEKTEYPLTIMIGPGKQLHLSLGYQTEHFNEDLIKNLAEHIKNVLQGVVSSPKEDLLKPIYELPLLTSQEKHQLLIEWNDTKADYPVDKTVHQLFEEQVKKTPNNTAVIYEDQELSYEQLNAKANQLAHYLRGQGVGPETLVAIAVERSLEMIIGLLAILKAGGAYVPLDPAYPEDRLQFMLEDTNAPLLITQAHLKERFNNYSGKAFSLQLDTVTKDLFIEDSIVSVPDSSPVWTNLSGESCQNPLSLSTPHNLAYVIYTSGSTGRPKGVQINCEGIINCIYSLKYLTNLDKEYTFFALTSISFDVAAMDYYLPFSIGAKVIISTQDEQKDPLALNEIIKKHAVNCIQGTPSLFYLLTAAPNYNLPHKLKLMLAGEALSQELAIKLEANNEVFNIYGPTEGTIYSSFTKVESNKNISIGTPIANTQLHILDESLNPVPIGVSGEIYIGGVGLARGYLNRPDLTAERFVPNPFVNVANIQGSFSQTDLSLSSDEKSLRLYRTGDLARYLPDGNIEFLGRIDDQVKIRGFRIELGEIESTLVNHGDVSQVVVMAREDEPGNKKLVAYIVPEVTKASSFLTQESFSSSSQDSFSILGGDSLPALTEDLRNHLARSLPEYMVPSFFVYLDKMPLTSNGKIDRKSFPAPDLSLRTIGDEYIAPQSDLQHSLAAIWSEVLKVEHIGIHDNFFKIGGHSLLATQVISRIRHTYQTDIPLRALFEHPTIASLEQVIEPLINQDSSSLLPSLTPQERPEHIPLSFAQQRLWFIEQLLPDNTLYNIPLALTLRGSLNIWALEKALNSLIQRHESLRTIFVSSDNQATQVILPSLSLHLEECILDLCELPQEQQASIAQDHAQEEVAKPFNLSSGPLIRLKLIRLKEDEHLLLLTLHHIISDGWSMGVFFKELSHLYSAYVSNKEPTLPPLALQYADFSIWQRKWLQGDVLDQQLSYWKKQLSDIPDLLELPTDKSRPKEMTYQGASLLRFLPPDMKEKLLELSQENQTSLFMTLLAAFQILLHRYTGQEDIVVGSPIANRHYKETEELIGFFVNTLALRTTFQDKDSFMDVLKRVQQATLDAYQHQDVPFEQLVDHLNLTRALNINPVFQVMFVFENESEREDLRLTDLQVEPFHTAYPIAKFDLLLSAFEEGEKIGLGFNYSTDLFQEATIERLADHLIELIQGILSNPYQPIYELPLLTSQEKHQLLIEWNNTKADYPADKTVHQLFEEQVKKTPHNTAVIYENQELSYEQLNAKANQLAHYLRGQGVGPDTLVAIAVERSLEMIIGLLAILKAGGAYVPLDPAYPEDRLQFMLEDTNAPLLITQAHLKERFNNYSGKAFSLQLDTVTKDLFIEDSIVSVPDSSPVWTNLSAESCQDLLSLSTLNNLAYVIYTSGSTGKPKGVMIGHNNIARLFFSTNQWYQFNSNDVWTFFHSYAFDFSVWEVWGALLYGGKLIVISYLSSRSPNLLNDILAKHDVTVLNQTPSSFKQLVNYQKTTLQQKKSNLRLIIFGGEALDPQILHSWFKEYSYDKPQLINMYGITETTVHVTYCPITVTFLAEGSRSIIGRLLPDLQAYILDEYLNPVPIGVSGEIYIGGVGLARGYLNRPDLTAERFVPNPFVNVANTQGSFSQTDLSLSSDEKSLRLYRTGDLARYLPDGNIEFLGRIDDQVKIRGFRIELGEIESTLVNHGDVSQVVVMAREDEPGNKKLVAYIVPEVTKASSFLTQESFSSSSQDSFSILGGDSLPALTEDLRNHLARSLPEYMVPSFFVYLDKMPLTSNGKIDRKSFPAPDLSLRTIGDEYIAPQSDLQHSLAAIWSEVLKVEHIGIHDNFFKIGGHSLLATQVISRIRHTYQTDIPLRALFEHPTIASLEQVIEPLINQDSSSLLPSLTPQERPEHIPLSFAQQRLWFIEQLLPDNTLYNIPLALTLRGSLNIWALEKALNSLIQRHESLRTIFVSSDNQATQVILPSLSLHLEECILDLCELPQEQQASIAQDHAQEEVAKPFNLSSGPLIRLKLIRLKEDEHLLLLTLHHIISDGWSMGVFFKELSHLYSAYVSNKEPTLPPLALQYADFSIWQRKWLQGDVLDQQLSYWKKQLSDIPDLLELPTDKSRPKEMTYQGASLLRFLPPDMKEKLLELSQENQTSLFMTLLAAFQILLHRYTGQEDIVVGSPIANRHYKETEELIGFFVNTLALRTTFQDKDSFMDVLKRVQQATLDAYQHQDVPFEQLVDHLNLTRALNINPVFQVMFVFQNAMEGGVFNLQHLQTEPFHTPYPIAKFDLTLVAFEEGEKIGLGFEYSTDLFQEATVERFADHLIELIQGILGNPYQPIYELPLLTSQEKHQLLIEWNNTKADYPADKTVHQLFEEQVKKTPHNTAVIYEDQELSYEQLNAKANQLAHYLRGQGVGPDTLVAIAVERSLEMIIGLLAILKAGGAYVPLDPAYPEDRLQFMLEDTNAPLLITQAHLKERFNNYSGKAFSLQLDTVTKDLLIEDSTVSVPDSSPVWTNLSAESCQDPLSLSTPNNLAYVIYTSGSTGKPKGVMIMHRGISNRLTWMENQYHLNHTDRVFQKTPFTFDVSVWELFWPLISGAIEVFAKPEGHKDVDYLLKSIQDKKISITHFVPSLLTNFLARIDKNDLVSLRLLIASGEALSFELKEECLLKLNSQLHNLYGPTEVSIDVSYFYCKPNNNISCTPIGTPIANTQLHILNESLNPVPIGVSGEIYIGGVGLARGYLNRPDLTAERFVPNPFVNVANIQGSFSQTDLSLSSDEKSLRLYRTGDLARYLPDGNIEFLGRIDDQVKIRGFRIELGEIESTLVNHGDVSQVVVMAREDEPGNKKLVAYIVPEVTKASSCLKQESFSSSSQDSFSILGGDSLPALTEDLRNHLARSLPEYMVPSFFVYLDKIPLTSNGKIDRKSFPAPDLSLRTIGDEYIAPQSDLQHSLAAIWSEVLKVEHIGIHDNFFKIGGHSLLATQVISRIRHTYQTDIPLRALFEHPTIASLEQVIEPLINQDSSSLLPSLTPQERPEHIPLSFAQQRLWFIEQLLPDNTLYNIPLALTLRGSLNIWALEKALNSLIQRHESLRTIFVSSDNQATQVILPSLSLHLEECILDLCELPQEQQASIAQDHAQEEVAKPFNLSSGPLIRLKLIRLKEDEHLLLLTLHHIISDGWSMGVFFKELSHLYSAYVSNKEPTLPPLALQYADFSIWQRKWLQGDVLDQQLSYWKKQLSDIPDLLELPTDKSRPKEMTYQGASLLRFLPPDMKEKLLELSQENQTSLFMTLLAAFQILLHRYTGQEDIVVGSPIANRHYKETEELIGFFVNTLALRTTFQDKDSFMDVLKRVQQATLDAYQHQDVPFEQLVDHLNLTRALNINPVFQVMFVFENESEREDLRLTDLQVEPFHTAYPIAKFDLLLSAFEEGEKIGLGFNYSTDLFQEATIERLADHLIELIQGILSNPYQPIYELPLLTSQEKHQLLIEWNNTKADYPADKTVHQLFEEQVKKTPHNTAVIYENQELSYEQLNAKANQLAHYLRGQGVGPDTLVAIAVERSLEMIIGLLAILKAGGAYVPLDPAYPEDRLQFMLEDTNAPLLITQAHLKERFNNYSGKAFSLQLDTVTKDLFIEDSIVSVPDSSPVWTNLSAESCQDLLSLSTPNNLAYIIYTSGSTGKPKGVMIGQENLINYINYARKNYPFSGGAAFLHSSISFDLSITSLFLPLVVGRPIYLLPFDSSIDILGEFLKKKNNFKLLKLTPSHLKALEGQFNAKELFQNGSLIIGGENLLKKELEPWLEVMPEALLFNEYGPTEATVGCCVFKINASQSFSLNSILIGSPIFNTICYVLDAHLELLPIGAIGELYVGGAGLARGYLNRPELTAERFIPNPFQTEGEKQNNKNPRLYKTGDLARWLPDGNLEYIGRNDFQVKIRGYRIELGEIENVLSSYEGITQSVVLTKEHAKTESLGNKYLVGYYVSEDQLNEGSILNYLSNRLPEYMIPSMLVHLNKLPLTFNGKLDRNALPEPEFSNSDTYIEPRNDLEKKIRQIWAEVLGLSENNISIHDDFFRLGGNSMLAIRLVGKLNKGLFRTLNLSSIFKNSSIEKLYCYLINTIDENKKGKEYEF